MLHLLLVTFFLLISRANIRDETLLTPSLYLKHLSNVPLRNRELFGIFKVQERVLIILCCGWIVIAREKISVLR